MPPPAAAGSGRRRRWVASSKRCVAQQQADEQQAHPEVAPGEGQVAAVGTTMTISMPTRLSTGGMISNWNSVQRQRRIADKSPVAAVHAAAAPADDRRQRARAVRGGMRSGAVMIAWSSAWPQAQPAAACAGRPASSARDRRPAPPRTCAPGSASPGRRSRLVRIVPAIIIGGQRQIGVAHSASRASRASGSAVMPITATPQERNSSRLGPRGELRPLDDDVACRRHGPVRRRRAPAGQQRRAAPGNRDRPTPTWATRPSPKKVRGRLTVRSINWSGTHQVAGAQSPPACCPPR